MQSATWHNTQQRDRSTNLSPTVIAVAHDNSGLSSKAPDRTAVQGGISVLKAVDLYLRKFRLKAELIKLIWPKRPTSQWIYTTLYTCT